MSICKNHSKNQRRHLQNNHLKTLRRGFTRKVNDTEIPPYLHIPAY